MNSSSSVLVVVGGWCFRWTTNLEIVRQASSHPSVDLARLDCYEGRGHGKIEKP